MDGCVWTGTWKHHFDGPTSHKNNCEFELIYCDNECKTQILRRNLKSHKEMDCPNRLISCIMCDDQIKFKEMSKHCEQECPEAKVSCPRNCGVAKNSLLRKQL